MRKSQNIFLIGPMGAGKTTIGRNLARVLGADFYDSDREIENRTGVDIPLIFEYEGEEGFRRREQLMIDELTQLTHVVLATGGGSILKEENRNHLIGRGFVVYLKCAVDCQLQRTHKDKHRPLLVNSKNPRKKLQEILKKREPFYLECADYVVDSGKWSSRSVVNDILKAYTTGNPV